MTELAAPPTRRPASHRWAIGIFALMSPGHIINEVAFFTGRSPHSLWEFPIMAICMWMGFIVFLALLAGRRRRWAYYVTAVCLAAWALRAVQTALFILADLILFVDWKLVRESNHLGYFLLIIAGKLLMVVVAALFGWLFIRFTFGAPSRSYFGLPPWRRRTP